MKWRYFWDKQINYAVHLVDLGTFFTRSAHRQIIPGSRGVIFEAVEQGITYFDSARAYAGSETYYGSVWPEHPDDLDTPINRALVVPMFPEVYDFGKRFGMRIKTTYGSTEVNAPLRLDYDHPDWKTCGYLKI